MRADAGGATPTSRLPRSRRPPTDPLTPTSALSVETARHAVVASFSASAASGAGAPGPDGSLTSGAAQPPQTTATPKNKPRKHENTKSGLYKMFFVLSCFRGP